MAKIGRSEFFKTNLPRWATQIEMFTQIDLDSQKVEVFISTWAPTKTND